MARGHFYDDEEPNQRFIWLSYLRDSLHVFLPVLVAGAITLYGFYPPDSLSSELECRMDYLKDELLCYKPCEHGTFFLPGMEECHKWLTCDDIAYEVQVQDMIGGGAVKKIQYAEWKGYNVTVNSLANGRYKEDFYHGLEMLKALQPHRRVVQFVGECKDTFITEHHHFKSAAYLEETLKIKQHAPINNLTTRFQLCLDYVEILSFLHSSPVGKRVMCDSSDLEKVLEQYLVTSDIRLLVNDLDALPEVTQGKGVKCGHRELVGDFVAPEQLWPHPDREFKDVDMPSYNEKIDIWKVPDVCFKFIGDNRGTDTLKFHLHKINTKCKNRDPRLRPTAKDLFDEYSRVRKYIGLHSYKEL